MQPELSDKVGKYEAAPQMPKPAPVSADRIAQDYRHFSGILDLYHSGNATISELDARKMESNTQTLARILVRIKREDCGAARRRLERAAILVGELKEIEEKEGGIVYIRKPAGQS